MSEIESLKHIESELNDLSQSAIEIIKNANNETELENSRVALLGKKGKLSNILKIMGKLTEEERPLIGQKSNLLKKKLL